MKTKLYWCDTEARTLSQAEAHICRDAGHKVSELDWAEQDFEHVEMDLRVY